MDECSRRIKEATYTTFVRLTVEYVSPVWDPHTGKNIKRLEQVQRSCARYVTSDFKRESSVTAMIQNLQSRRLLSRLHMMYRIRNDLVDINWKQHLTQASTTTTRGHSSRFQLRRCNTGTYLQSFFPRTAKDWNLLPTDFPSLDAFKSALGTLLL